MLDPIAQLGGYVKSAKLDITLTEMWERALIEAFIEQCFGHCPCPLGKTTESGYEAVSTSIQTIILYRVIQLLDCSAKASFLEGPKTYWN